MAKSQLFKWPLSWVYKHGGVFPVRRGARDDEAFVTARHTLDNGGCVAMYCEGGRSRTGKLAERAKPGIGRLALGSGATIVPVAIHGSSHSSDERRAGTDCVSPLRLRWSAYKSKKNTHTTIN